MHIFFFSFFHIFKRNIRFQLRNPDASKLQIIDKSLRSKISMRVRGRRERERERGRRDCLLLYLVSESVITINYIIIT